MAQAQAQLTALKAQTPDPQVVADLREAISYLQAMPEVGDHKIGGVGFCAGGRWGLFFAARKVSAVT